MEITGKLIKILPNVECESQRGHWVRGGFVIETDGEYPRMVAFTVFGEERVAMVQNVPMNSTVVVTFSPESREYNDRWYTDLRCSRVQTAASAPLPGASQGYAWSGAPQGQPAYAATQQGQPTQQSGSFATPPQMADNSNDDLPF